MATVSCTGSMLSCKTPMLNEAGMNIAQLLALRNWFADSNTQFLDFGSQFSELNPDLSMNVLIP